MCWVQSSARALLGAALPSVLCGCMASPTPLVPSLGGSVGVPHQGVLTEPLELASGGPGFRRYRPHGTAHFGLPRLVRGLEQAALAVAEERPGGARLVIGDLSAETGGKIPRHNSHRTGRDVDLLFYVVSPEGVPIESPGFVALGPDGFVKLEDGRYLRLDVERQWLLIRALLTDPELRVQFLFICRDLEALIIQYALAKETDLELISRAQTVMVEPVDSLPHDDHIHMRIACAPNEAVGGCMGGGPHWSWLPPLPETDLSDQELVALVAESDPFPPLERTTSDAEANAEANAEAPRSGLGPVLVSPHG